MTFRYLHLDPGQALPLLDDGPWRVALVSETSVDRDWRNLVCDWLVASDCLYFVAWGIECEIWHDSLDDAVLDRFDYGEIPDRNFVMTTWHADEPMEEAMWFAACNAYHPDVDIERTLLLHVAPCADETRIWGAFRLAEREA
jgi:hypothetical protein